MADSLLNNNKNTDENITKSEEEQIDKSLLCGWLSWRPTFLQRFASPKWFILLLSLFSIVQAILVMGLTSATLPAIEKEFGLSSKQTAIILLSNDVAGIILLPVISFFGTYAKKPKWIGNGAVVTGIGALLMCLPKMIIGDYIITGSDATKSKALNLCSLESNWLGNQSASAQCSDNKGFASSTKYVAIFAIAQFIMGAGTTPAYPLGPAYMDENVDPKMSPVYIGIWFMCNFLGPGLGYMLGAAFLGIFTNLKLPNGVILSRRDPQWVGAWWLGFFSLSFILFFSGALLLCFPREMAKYRKKRVQAINDGALPTSDREIGKGFKDLLKATLNLIQNRMYIFSCFALSIKIMFGAALGGFFTKVVILKFGGSLSEVAVYAGAVLMPAMASGISLGSFIMRKLPLKGSAKSAALLLIISSAVAFLLSLLWLLPGCNTTNIAGVSASYANSSSKHSLISTCNRGCACSKRVYDPVCGADGMTYFSPCFAGCQGMNSKGFGNCSCISMNRSTAFHVQESNFTLTENDHNFQTSIRVATKGRCDRNCRNLFIFLILSAIAISMSFLGAIPQKMMTLRCVPDNLRSYALGLQLLIMRSFSFIPGPLILGSIIDSNCLVWRKDSCGNKGNCLEYNITRLSTHFLLFAASATGIATVLYFFAWYCYEPADTEDNNADNNLFLMDEMQLKKDSVN